MKKYLLISVAGAVLILSTIIASTSNTGISQSNNINNLQSSRINSEQSNSMRNNNVKIKNTSQESFELKPAQLRSDFSIIIDGKTVYLKSASNEALYPILYNDSTYLPLRAIGEIMGKNVNWDEQSKTINISGSREVYSDNQPNKDIGIQQISVQERSDFTINIDNKTSEFRSASGQKLYPILYNGSTYLPLRSIGTIINKEVLWDASSKTVNLKSKNDFTVTDADSFNSNNNSNNAVLIEGNQNNSGTNLQNINIDKAKSIAAEHAGFNISQVNFIKTELDFDDGRYYYDIEFVVNNTEYDYEVDAQTGQILEHKIEKDKRSIHHSNNNQNNNTASSKITLEEAKNIAIKHSGVNASNVVFKKAKKDYDDGRYIYEIEFRLGNVEYEYEIDAQTGEILEYKSEYDN